MLLFCWTLTDVVFCLLALMNDHLCDGADQIVLRATRQAGVLGDNHN